MSDDSSPEAPVQSTEPIDAHFEPAPEEETKPGRRKGRTSGPGWLGAGVLSLLAALAGGAIGIGADRLKPANAAAAGVTPADLSTLTGRLDKLEQVSPGTADLRTDLDALSQKIDSLAKAAPGSGKLDLSSIEARLKALETAPAGDGAAPEALSRSVAALSARLDQVESRPEPPDDENRIAALEAEVTRLQQAASEQASQGQSLADVVRRAQTGEEDARAAAASASTLADAALALSGIEAASRRGLPFENDYHTLRTALPKLDAVRQLGPVAETGAPTLAALSDQFAKASEAARRAVPAGDEGRFGWLNRVFGGAVTVRKADGTDDGDPFALLSRAEDALQDGDLAGAVTYTGRLDGPPAAEMAAWTEAAKRRISLETSLEALRRLLAEGGSDIQ